MKPNYIVPASMIGYFVLSILLCQFNIWVFSANLFFAGCSIALQGLFLFEGRWTTRASGERDRNFGAMMVTCLFVFAIGQYISEMILNRIHTTLVAESRENLAIAIGVATAVVILLLDFLWIKRQHSLLRRGILLLLITLALISLWVVDSVSLVNGSVAERSFLFSQSATDALSQMKLNFRVIFPMLWPIAPGLALLRKAADGPEPEAPPVDPFLDPNEPAKPRVAPKHALPQQDQAAMRKPRPK